MPKIFIEFFIVFLACGTIFYSLFLNLDLVALIPIVALYFFAALRIYPSLNAVLLNRITLIQGQVSVDQIYNEILESNKDIDSYKNNEQQTKLDQTNHYIHV